jgi:hypothetical protein
MSKKYLIAAILILPVVIAISCSKSGTSGGANNLDCTTITNKAFAADINPIIQTNCNISGCHATGSFNGPGALTNYTQISTAASVIRSAVSSGRMPQGGSLTILQKKSILCWIDGGAPNN